MLRGIDNYFDPTYETVVACFGGHTPAQLVEEVDSVFEGKNFESVILHCGTNCATKKRPNVREGFQKLIDRIQWHTKAPIVLSGAIHRLDDQSLNSKIDSINSVMSSFEDSSEYQVLFVEHNATFRHLNKLLDHKGLHLRASGLKQVAANLSLTLKTGLFPRPQCANGATLSKLHQGNRLTDPANRIIVIPIKRPCRNQMANGGLKVEPRKLETLPPGILADKNHIDTTPVKRTPYKHGRGKNARPPPPPCHARVPSSPNVETGHGTGHLDMSSSATNRGTPWSCPDRASPSPSALPYWPSPATSPPILLPTTHISSRNMVSLTGPCL